MAEEYLLSEEAYIAAYELDNPADDHAIGVCHVAAAEHQAHIDKGWKSPEEVKELADRQELYTKEVMRIRQAERSSALREVADVLNGKDWFGEKLSPNQRLTVLEYIRAGKFDGRRKVREAKRA